MTGANNLHFVPVSRIDQNNIESARRGLQSWGYTNSILIVDHGKAINKAFHSINITTLDAQFAMAMEDVGACQNPEFWRKTYYTCMTLFALSSLEKILHAFKQDGHAQTLVLHQWPVECLAEDQILMQDHIPSLTDSNLRTGEVESSPFFMLDIKDSISGQMAKAIFLLKAHFLGGNASELIATHEGGLGEMLSAVLAGAMYGPLCELS